MLLDVIAVRVLPEYRLELEFENGEFRLFDMRPLFGMKPWDRIVPPEVFKRVRVDYGTVVWPGGVDIAPETLYLDSIPLSGAQSSEQRRIGVAKGCFEAPDIP